MFSEGTHLWRERGTVDARGVLHAEGPQAPHERHSVGSDKIRCVHDVAIDRVVTGVHHIVDGRHADVARLHSFGPLDHALGRVVVAGSVNAHADYVA